MNVLLFLIIFLIPINLGKHFEIQSSYVSGLLVDYLVPTLFVQDILVVLFLLLNFRKFKLVNKPWVKFFLWFIISGLFSVLVSSERVIATSIFLRTFIYGILMYLISFNFKFSKNKKVIFNAFMLNTLLLSILGIAQWFHQGSIFDNYLFFGEQPYNVSTYNINIESFFSTTKVPSYGTFRHPNVFGAYLSVVLIWLYSKLKKHKSYYLVFILGLITLFFTLSKVAILTFFLGILLYSLKDVTFKKLYPKIFLFTFVLTGCFAILSKNYFTESSSIYRRRELIIASSALIKENILYGVGPGLFTHELDSFLNTFTDSNFIQPVHNMYLLLLTEYGLIAFILFILFLYFKIKSVHGKKLLIISFMQLLFLGVFDHYVFTSHQLHLLFWLLIGFI